MDSATLINRLNDCEMEIASLKTKLAGIVFYFAEHEGSRPPEDNELEELVEAGDLLEGDLRCEDRPMMDLFWARRLVKRYKDKVIEPFTRPG